MPHGWLFSGPLTAWRRRCARADAPRLLQQATEAFVDRAPIDWTALRARASRPEDRALLENLQILDRLRTATMSTVVEWSAAITVLVRVVVALAVVQIAAAAAIVATALLDGRGYNRLVVAATLAGAYIASAGLLAATTSGDPRRLFLLSAFLGVASSFMRGAAAAVDPGWLSPAGLLVRGVSPEVFTPACTWLFALTFPRVTRFTAFDALARRATAAAWGLGLAAFVLNAYVAFAPAGGGEHAFADLLPTSRSNLFWRVFTIVDLLAVLAIFVRSRRAPPAERRKVVRVAKALGVCLMPFFVVGLARTVLPSIDAWLVSAAPGERAWLDVIILTALAAAPMLTTIAVIVDRPFDLQGAVRVTWRYAFARSARSVQREQRQIARDIEAIRLARGDRDRARVLERAITRHLNASTARILVPRASGDFQDYASQITMSARSALYAMLRAAPEPISLAPGERVTQLLPDRDRQWLIDNEIDLVASIGGADGEPAAIAIAGRSRLPAPAVDRGEAWVMAALIAAAAACWSQSSREHDARAFECTACGALTQAARQACRCGATPVPSLLPARIADRFAVQRRIGAGGLGVVYVARDERLGRDVALKTLTQSNLDAHARARLKDEARAMAALNHESLATIYGLEFCGATPVLVVEYFPEGTLAGRLASGPLAPFSVIRIGRALAGALVYMHERGVLHRDLKPSNIGLTAHATPKLLDFGLSTGDGSAPTTQLAGTAGYLPPEAYRGAPADARFDLWALAVVLLESLTGVNPFAASDESQIARRIANGWSGDVVVPGGDSRPELSRLLVRMLARNPDERPPTAAVVLAELEQIQRNW